VHLVGSAAGPLGGDRYHLSVLVAPGASLVLRSAAATIALPGPDGAASQLDVELAVAAGASLWWLPEPVVAAAGCDHHVRTKVRLAASARLVLRDELVLGRHGEPGGSVWQRLVVDRDGAPLVRNELRVGPRWPGGGGPAVLADARAVAQTLVVGVDLATTEPATGVRGASMSIAAGAILRTELACAPGQLVAGRPVPPPDRG
jgi:urease accessory protein